MTLYELLSKVSANTTVSILQTGGSIIDDESACNIRIPFWMLASEVKEFYTAITSNDDGWTGAKLSIIIEE